METKFWDDDRVKDLKNRFTAGESPETIARAFDKTRNAIIGKLHRLGLSNRDRPIAAVVHRRPTSKATANKTDLVALVAAALTKRPKTERPGIETIPAVTREKIPYAGKDPKAVHRAPKAVQPEAPPMHQTPPPLHQEVPAVAQPEPARLFTDEQQREALDDLIDEAEQFVAEQQLPPPEAVPDNRPPGARTLLELGPGQCRFPLGSTWQRPEFFCAQPVCDRGPAVYCAACAMRAYQPIGKQNRSLFIDVPQTPGGTQNGKASSKQPKNFASI